MHNRAVPPRWTLPWWRFENSSSTRHLQRHLSKKVAFSLSKFVKKVEIRHFHQVAAYRRGGTPATLLKEIKVAGGGWRWHAFSGEL